MDVEVARDHVTRRLEQEFGGRFSTETIDRFVNQAFDELIDHAAVDTFVPVLAERFARQQLTALARVEGHDDTLPVVLFLDLHDAGRSQLARALFERHAGDRAHAWSGGFDPRHEIDPGVAASLGEFEIDLTHQYPKPITDEIVAGADVVVLLGQVPAQFPDGQRVERWDVAPLDGLGEAEIAGVRDAVDALAADLADQVAPPAAAG